MTRLRPAPLCARIEAHARTRPDAIAYAGEWGRVSRAEQQAAIERIAAALHALSLPRGSCVAVWLPDGPWVHASLAAAERAGLVALGIGPRAGGQEVEHLVRQAGARALVSQRTHQEQDTAELFTTLRARVPELRHHLVCSDADAGTLVLDCNGTRLDAARALPAPPPDRTLASDEIWLLNSTSGTTGMPKCVVHDLDRWLAFHALAVPRGRLTPDDVLMSVVPAPFGFGLWTSHVTPSVLGCTTVVMERFDASRALDLVEAHRVSVLAAVSTQFVMMIGALGERPRDLSSLRVLFTGGEAVPYERALEFETRTGACVLQFYGSNETGAVSGTSMDDDRELRLRTAGRVIPEMQVRLFDEAGADVTHTGRGRPGCKGPTLSRGYTGEGSAAANAELIREDGWMLLGDIVTLEDGVLSVVGRSDDFIIRGGKNVSAAAVEAQVMRHPLVSVAAAVAMPDPVFGERVCVFVELVADAARPAASAVELVANAARSAAGAIELASSAAEPAAGAAGPPPSAPLDLAALVRFLADQRVSKESWPERLEVLDALPRGSGGKIAKGKLRDQIRARLERERGAAATRS